MDVTPGQIILFALAGVVLWWTVRRKPAPVAVPGAAPVESTPHFFLRWGLIVWALAYPVVSCAPLFATPNTAGGNTVGGLATLVVGATLFGPWVVGLLVLGVLVWATR